MAEISPSILAADFARLGEQVDDAARGGARMLHVDAMDGHFVPNISIGIPVVRSLSRWTDMVLDCHLMVSNPESYLDAFVCAGARMVTVHQEACPHLGKNGRPDQGTRSGRGGRAESFNSPRHARRGSSRCGRVVLVMSVHPGFGGQEFLPSSIGKIARLNACRRQRRLDFRIQVDGGVNLDNAAPLGEAGCDILVAGSSVFRKGDIAAAVRGLASQANRPALANA